MVFGARADGSPRSIVPATRPDAPPAPLSVQLHDLYGCLRRVARRCARRDLSPDVGGAVGPGPGVTIRTPDGLRSASHPRNPPRDQERLAPILSIEHPRNRTSTSRSLGTTRHSTVVIVRLLRATDHRYVNGSAAKLPRRCAVGDIQIHMPFSNQRASVENAVRPVVRCRP